jgi:hypothetical protein
MDMKTLVTVNAKVPTCNEHLSYGSGRSLQDYEIILIDPVSPYYDRIHFDGGGSTISIEDGQRAIAHIAHWKSEITDALKAGKTVFFLLAQKSSDSYATGYSTPRAHHRSYSSNSFSNYDVMPFQVDVVNSKGTRIKCTDARFKALFDGLENHARYEVYLNDENKSPIATTISGDWVLSSIYRLKGYSGHLVLLPYFNLDIESLSTTDKTGDSVWTKVALGLGEKLKKNLIELDRALTQQSDRTPQPDWVSHITKSNHINKIQSDIEKINREIISKQEAKDRRSSELSDALGPTALLYETGKPLEHAVEAVLKQLGYDVSNFREGSLEIDHVIVSPDGRRLIGEAEGRDSAAISVDKFRQLETNILEDFQRDEVTERASGVLFGNGYRLESPASRQIQFTDKCLKNAEYSKVALVQTSDLFPLAMYLQDNPKDEKFKSQCRAILESGVGAIAKFPSIPVKEH